jgi:hypothetical protein
MVASVFVQGNRTEGHRNFPWPFVDVIAPVGHWMIEERTKTEPNYLLIELDLAVQVVLCDILEIF